MRQGIFIATIVVGFVAPMVSPAQAQDTLPTQVAPQVAPVDRVGVEVASVACGLEGAAIRAALSNELAATVVTELEAPARIIIGCDGDWLRIAYSNGAQPLIKRESTLPVLASDRLRLIVYLATNLVHDESADVLANLQRRAAAVPPAAADTVPVAPPAAMLNRLRPQPTYMPASIGFLPPLAVERLAGAHTRVGVGVNVLIGVSDAASIVSISGLADIKRESVAGAQLGGLVARAAQLDGGVQLAGLVASTDNVADGVQVGGLAAVSRDVAGVQLGGTAALARGRLDGVQLGGVVSIARELHGVQLAGIANIASDVDGVQLSLVNVAKRMRGVQIGLLNISETSQDAYPIGLLNFARDGQVSVDAWAESSQVTAVALRHGTRRVHNVWGLAWAPDHPDLLVGAGLGVHLPMQSGNRAIGMDIEAMAWLTDLWHGNHGSLEQLRATVAVPLGPVEIIAGAAVNVGIDKVETANDAFHPVLAKRFVSDDGVHVAVWPTVFAGLRFRAR